jgi:hypothetical protein
MAAPALDLDLTGIAVNQLEIPDPIANAFVLVQTTVNSLGNIHVASDAAIATSKLQLASHSPTPIVLDNNVFYRALDAGAVLRDLLGLDTASNVIFSANINGTIVEGCHEESFQVNVGSLGAGAQSAQQVLTYRRAFTTATRIITHGVGSTEGNPIQAHFRQDNLGSCSVYIENEHSATQTNCTVNVRVIGK